MNTVTLRMLEVDNVQHGVNSLEPKRLVKAVVPVRLRNPKTGKAVTVQADLDTGADHCHMSLKVQEALGLGILVEPPATTSAAGGIIRSQAVRVELELLSDERTSLRQLPITHFYVNPDAPYHVVLGVVGFMDQFSEVAMRYPRRELELRW